MINEVCGQQPSVNNNVKVLFIAGPTRSGSTIIGNILGQIKGFFHAGELIEAWDRGRTWKCSCGKDPIICEVWSQIFKTLNSVISRTDQAEIIRIRNKLSQSLRVIINQYQHPYKLVPNTPEDRYLSGLATLYKIIQNKTGAEIIIDSSKNVGYCETLKRVNAIELYVLHLIRDSRAIVFSWSKKKRGLWKVHPLKTAAVWSSRNMAAEFLKSGLSNRYIKMRYEDFINTPQEKVRAILKILNVGKVQLPFISSNEVMLKTSHGLCGNPGRFNCGVEKLEMDNRWKNMKLSDNLMATFLTWPLLLRYNYQLLDLAKRH
jgi:hypothetical protein